MLSAIKLCRLAKEQSGSLTALSPLLSPLCGLESTLPAQQLRISCLLSQQVLRTHASASAPPETSVESSSGQSEPPHRAETEVQNGSAPGVQSQAVAIQNEGASPSQVPSPDSVSNGNNYRSPMEHGQEGLANTLYVEEYKRQERSRAARRPSPGPHDQQHSGNTGVAQHSLQPPQHQHQQQHQPEQHQPRWPPQLRQGVHPHPQQAPVPQPPADRASGEQQQQQQWQPQQQQRGIMYPPPTVRGLDGRPPPQNAHSPPRGAVPSRPFAQQQAGIFLDDRGVRIAGPPPQAAARQPGSPNEGPRPQEQQQRGRVPDIFLRHLQRSVGAPAEEDEALRRQGGYMGKPRRSYYDPNYRRDSRDSRDHRDSRDNRGPRPPYQGRQQQRGWQDSGPYPNSAQQQQPWGAYPPGPRPNPQLREPPPAQQGYQPQQWGGQTSGAQWGQYYGPSEGYPPYQDPWSQQQPAAHGQGYQPTPAQGAFYNAWPPQQPPQPQGFQPGPPSPGGPAAFPQQAPPPAEGSAAAATPAFPASWPQPQPQPAQKPPGPGYQGGQWQITAPLQEGAGPVSREAWPRQLAQQVQTGPREAVVPPQQAPQVATPQPEPQAEPPAAAQPAAALEGGQQGLGQPQPEPPQTIPQTPPPEEGAKAGAVAEPQPSQSEPAVLGRPKSWLASVFGSGFPAPQPAAVAPQPSVEDSAAEQSSPSSHPNPPQKASPAADLQVAAKAPAAQAEEAASELGIAGQEASSDAASASSSEQANAQEFGEGDPPLVVPSPTTTPPQPSQQEAHQAGTAAPYADPWQQQQQQAQQQPWPHLQQAWTQQQPWPQQQAWQAASAYPAPGYQPTWPPQQGYQPGGWGGLYPQQPQQPWPQQQGYQPQPGWGGDPYPQQYPQQAPGTTPPPPPQGFPQGQGPQGWQGQAKPQHAPSSSVRLVFKTEEIRRMEQEAPHAPLLRFYRRSMGLPRPPGQESFSYRRRREQAASGAGASAEGPGAGADPWAGIPEEGGQAPPRSQREGEEGPVPGGAQQSAEWPRQAKRPGRQLRQDRLRVQQDRLLIQQFQEQMQGGVNPQALLREPAGSPSQPGFRPAERRDNKESPSQQGQQQGQAREKGPRQEGRLSESEWQRRAAKAEAERKAAAEKRAAKTKPAPEVVLREDMTVAQLAKLLGVPQAKVEEILTVLGEPPSSGEDVVSLECAELAAIEVGRVAVVKRESGSKDADAEPRPAVVTVMGHVDHGKTSLLDALRRTSVAAGEAGGITQHIGAFEVAMPDSGASLTFIDTPGHAAFSAMRARGAAVTDLVVLVVAADDGVMPQTREAIAHAQAARCPIVVALSKCDVPQADPQRVRDQLVVEGLELEEVGGSVQVVEVAAPAGLGLRELEEALLLQAEMMDLKASRSRDAEAVVVEAKLDKGQGAVATVVALCGTLRVGQWLVAGQVYGRVRGLRSGSGEAVEHCLPGQPVEIMGLRGVPEAGDRVVVVDDEERASRLSQARAERRKLVRSTEQKEAADAVAKEAAAQEAARDAARDAATAGGNGAEAAAVEGLGEDEPRSLAVILKADVQGSLEAVRHSIMGLATDQVGIKIVGADVGPVASADVRQAQSSGAVIVAFNVKPATAAVALSAKQAGVDIRTHAVIYHLLEEVGALQAALAPQVKEEVVVGQASVLQVFPIKNEAAPFAAGCRVTEGSLKAAGTTYRVLRSGEVLHSGSASSLRRQRQEVGQVGKGTECGLVLAGYGAWQPGDVLQCIEERSRPATADELAAAKKQKQQREKGERPRQAAGGGW